MFTETYGAFMVDSTIITNLAIFMNNNHERMRQTKSQDVFK